jgi:hypothetical protein
MFIIGRPTIKVGTTIEVGRPPKRPHHSCVPRNRGNLETTLVVAYEVDGNALDVITLNQTVRDAELVVKSRI